jgi:hypothetical protein
MCFSATASFTAAGALGVIGAYSLRHAKAPRTVMFRAIPLVFAAHQFVEGLMWRAWASRTSPRVESWLVHVWMLVALAVWPAWMPIACALMERNSRRRGFMLALSVLGTGFGAYVLRHAIVQGAWSCVQNGHFFYSVHFTRPMEPIVHSLYAICTITPLLLSTSPGTKRLAVALAVSGIAAVLIYKTSAISVWCFFAAWLSVIVVRSPESESEQTRRELRGVRKAGARG